MTGTSAENRSQLWTSKHKRGFIGSLAGAAILFGGGTGLLEYSQQKREIADNHKYATMDGHCLQIIKRNDLLGSGKVTLKLSDLQSQQKKDCGVDGIEGYVNSGSPDLAAKVVDAEVELPSENQLQSAYKRDVQAASAGINEFEIGRVGALGGFLGLMLVYGGTLLFSGDLERMELGSKKTNRE